MCHPFHLVILFQFFRLLVLRLEPQTLANMGNMWPLIWRDRPFMLHSVLGAAFAFSAHWNLTSENPFGSTECKSWSHTIPRGACATNLNFDLWLYYIYFFSQWIFIGHHCVIFLRLYNMKSPPMSLENQGTGTHLFSQGLGLTCKM